MHSGKAKKLSRCFFMKHQLIPKGKKSEELYFNRGNLAFPEAFLVGLHES